MSNPLPRLLIILGLAVPSAANAADHAPHAHEHGMARLAVAVDGGLLTIVLESPLDSLLGFEHAPRNDREKASVQAMADRLRKPETLFILPTAAQCHGISVTLTSPVLEAKPDEKAGGHTDLGGEFVFQCAQPQQLKGMTVRLFQAFPHLRQITVQTATPRGQGAAVLTPQRPQLRW